MSALLEAASLSKTFFSEHNALPAVCNVSFSVAPGECLGLAGASGCGKSTLARLLMGLTPADSGTVSFNGQPLDFADAALRKYQTVTAEHTLRIAEIAVARHFLLLQTLRQLAVFAIHCADNTYRHAC